MPRVSLAKKNYNAKDLCAWVISQAKITHTSMEEIARYIGTTRQSLYRKMLDGKGTFTYQELMHIFKLLGATDEEIIKFMRI